MVQCSREFATFFLSLFNSFPFLAIPSPVPCPALHPPHITSSPKPKTYLTLTLFDKNSLVLCLKGPSYIKAHLITITSSNHLNPGYDAIICCLMLILRNLHKYTDRNNNRVMKIQSTV